MSLTRTQKEEIIQKVSKDVSEATSVVFVGFDGVTLKDMTDLRDKLHEAGCKMKVVPKRLLKLALTDAKVDFDPKQHEDQVAVVWGSDVVAPAKFIYEFAKQHEDQMRILSGVLEGNVITMEQATALAKLPSRQQLLGQLVGVLAGPMRGFAMVLSGVPRSMVYVLQAIKESKE
ncbi:MAG: 50S ribosomal protein L10 [Candidatus Andersenbacteria bacterium]|nr:50S ribosomal protein L10 [Candidatus Andersenbacteria bacterium]MBI3250470.1 50S ribosomal protein L10 [Candidatus Andersenbacteria bacterium]